MRTEFRPDRPRNRAFCGNIVEAIDTYRRRARLGDRHAVSSLNAGEVTFRKEYFRKFLSFETDAFASEGAAREEKMGQRTGAVRSPPGSIDQMQLLRPKNRPICIAWSRDGIGTNETSEVWSIITNAALGESTRAGASLQPTGTYTWRKS